MKMYHAAYVLWLLSVLAPIALGILIGGVRNLLTRFRTYPPDLAQIPIEIFVPVKGVVPNQHAILENLLQQTYANYSVNFLIETSQDAANQTVDELCRTYSHCRKYITGLTKKSAQKNHNLIVGVQHAQPETKLFVFCDSTNSVTPTWLDLFTRPLRNDDAPVVTTFRVFQPKTESWPALCQCVYSSIMQYFAATFPTPWGGATAIRRDVFERLNVVQEWSDTVVDDLTLGNTLRRAGVTIWMDPENLLKSPLENQTFGGYLHYFERQALFPKFTNPFLWIAVVVVCVNLAVGVLTAALFMALYPFGVVGATTAGISLVFSLVFFVILYILKRANPYVHSLSKWVAASLLCVFLNVYVVLKTINNEYIDWHGRRYYAGKNGKVFRIEPL